MSEKEIKQIFRNQRSRRSWRCPDDAKLAAYTDQNLDSASRTSLERHLSTCNSCLAQISFLIKSGEWTNYEQVPPHLLAKAKDLTAPDSRSSWFWSRRWALATAAAACLIFAFIIVVALRSHNSTSSLEGPMVAQNHPHAPTVIENPQRSPVTESSPTSVHVNSRDVEPKPQKESTPSIKRPQLLSTVRGVAPPTDSASPALIFPTENSVIKSGETELRWKAVSGAVSYEVSILTADGALVLNRTTDQNQVTVKLKPGTKYFAQVQATMREGKSIKSQMVSFRVTN